MTKSTHVYCSKIANIPTMSRFAILLDQVVCIHDSYADTHSSPYTTETMLQYIAFTEEQEWQTMIRELTMKNTPFRAFEVCPVEIETTITVKIIK